jgi:hypothetical protein
MVRSTIWHLEYLWRSELYYPVRVELATPGRMCIWSALEERPLPPDVVVPSPKEPPRFIAGITSAFETWIGFCTVRGEERYGAKRVVPSMARGATDRGGGGVWCFANCVPEVHSDGEESGPDAIAHRAIWAHDLPYPLCLWARRSYTRIAGAGRSHRMALGDHAFPRSLFAPAGTGHKSPSHPGRPIRRRALSGSMGLCMV